MVKKMVEWKVKDRWDEENNWLLEGRTVLIFKGGDRKDPANYRPITCLPTITKWSPSPSTNGYRDSSSMMLEDASWNVSREEFARRRDARRL